MPSIILSFQVAALPLGEPGRFKLPPSPMMEGGTVTKAGRCGLTHIDPGYTKGRLRVDPGLTGLGLG